MTRNIIKGLLALFWGLVLTSCNKLRNCKECQMFDTHGNKVGTVELCGSKLKEAEKDTLFECR